MTTSPRALAVATAALAAAAGFAAFDLARRDDRRAAASAAFQRLTGGLGFGASLDPSSCAAEFDPRTEGTCPDRFDPLPGGDVLCPWLGAPHGGSRPR